MTFIGEVKPCKDKHGEITTLVVLLHAWTHRASDLEDVIQAVKAEDAFGEAELYAPEYPAGWMSSASPTSLAEELADRLDHLENSKRNDGTPYKNIILIGHSLGALLARKAYVIARGQAQDCQQRERSPMPWAGLVERIILLAGMNRGWSYEARPVTMGFVRFQTLRLGALSWRWFRFPKLINSIRRGSPFIVNLRIQWLNLLKEQKQSQTSMPLVIQLLGTVDDLVTRDDNVDLQCGAGFRYLRVLDTGHGNVIRFTNDRFGAERKRIFLHALTSDQQDIKSDLLIPVDQDFSVKSVVFVIHGIRDFGDWTAGVAEMIERMAISNKKIIRSFHPSYGYFNMLDFLAQFERKRNVRWFMDEITQKRALFPEAEISFVGHSNGTYLLGSALRDYAAITFDRAVLAGCVLPRNYEWDLILGSRINKVLNFVAAGDKVVAVLPKIFEDFSERSELGSAGANGFLKDPGKEIRFIPGGHGAALVPENYENIARFIVEGVATTPEPPLFADARVKWVELASKFSKLLWLVMLTVVTVVAFIPLILAHYRTGVFSLSAWHYWLAEAVWVVFLRYFLKHA